jgi:hypothetical protein
LNQALADGFLRHALQMQIERGVNVDAAGFLGEQPRAGFIDELADVVDESRALRFRARAARL